MSLWYPCIYCTEDLRCEKYSGDGVISYCVLGPCSDEKPSNADRIRAMGDKELANFLMDVASRGGIQTESGITRWTLIDWLEQEAT